MADFLKPAPEPSTPLGRHRCLSSSAGIRVSPLALGGMSIGENWASFMGSMNKEQSFKLLDSFREAGGNFIDTASGYQAGQSEQWIGEWLTSRGCRDEMIIATKWSFHSRAHRNEDKTPANNNFWGNNKRNMSMALRDSLKLLQTDWVDVLYLHFWDYMTSIEEVMDSLHILVEQGKVMYLGISDTPAWIVAGANYYARAHGKTPFSIYQGRWNVLARDLEREILPMTLHFGMSITAWDVLCNGKLQSEKQLAERKRAGEPNRFGTDPTPEQTRMSQELLKVAKAHGSESTTAVAIAYLRSKAPNVVPIVGGRKVEHLKDNITSLNIRLTHEEIQQLEAIAEFDLGFPGAFFGQDWRITGEAPTAAKGQGPFELVKY